MPYIVKTLPVAVSRGDIVRLEERPMYGGRDIAPGERIYLWFSEQQGGFGLFGNGSVLRLLEAGARVGLDVRIDNVAVARCFGVAEISPYRDLADGSAVAGLSSKLYRHSHNKIASLTASEACFLDQYFEQG